MQEAANADSLLSWRNSPVFLWNSLNQLKGERERCVGGQDLSKTTTASKQQRIGWLEEGERRSGGWT